MRAAVAIGLGVLGLVTVGGIAYAANSSGSAAPQAPTFSASAAVPLAPGTSVTVTVGSSITVEQSAGQPVTTSNAAAVVSAPSGTSFPSGMTNGFLAIAPGTSDLTTASGGIVHVTVVTSMAAAAGTTTTTSSSSSSTTTTTSSSTSSNPAAPQGPRGLVSSAPTSTGWAMAVAIQPNMSGLNYQGFYGDVVRVSLPAGAHWRASSASMGPSSGTDDFVFTLIEPVVVVLSYTDHARLDTGTTLFFDIGGVFEKSSAIATDDYVLFAIAQADLQTTFATLNAALNAPAGPTASIVGQEAQTLAALQAGLSGAATTVTALLTWLFLAGPWADVWAFDVHSVAILPAGTPTPSWWPSDDTAAATESHVLARYVGQWMQVSAAPFPVTAWKRVA